jgi:ABC-type antimicrobial peptide transport system permease subunit
MHDGVDPLSIATAARDQVRALDARQPVTDMQTYDSIVAKSMSTRRFTLALLALFAGTAMVLAVVGLYGAVSYVVGQRRRELGVRVALGAGRKDIRRLVLRQGMRPVVGGAVLGLIAAFAGAHAIRSMLFGVAPADAVTFVAVLAAIAGGSLLACLIPANRAARIDPAVALRAE